MMPFIPLGAAQIPVYPLAYALAFFTFAILALSQVRDGEMDSSRVRFGLLACAVAFIAGLYLPGLATMLIERIRFGQPSGPLEARVYYGLAAALLTGLLVNRGYPKINLIRNLDRFIIYLPLAYAIARLGCLAAGCCGGAETSSPLGMFLPDDHARWANRYPTQLMSAATQLALFVFFSWAARWREIPPHAAGWKAWLNRPGVIFCAYLLAFCLERFILDFLRYDHHPIWGPFGLPQLLMLAGMAAAVSGLARAKPAAQPIHPRS